MHQNTAQARVVDSRSLIEKASYLLLACIAAVLCVADARAESPRIAASADDVQPVAAGQPAPSFTVQTVDGEDFEFRPDALERPAMIITFRGGWCPYCNMHLSELRHVLPEINALGVDVLFLSGDRPEILYESLKPETQDDIAGLGYTIYSDASAGAAEALGIAFSVDPTYAQRLRDGNRDIEASSIDRAGVLPVPAVFAIASDGTVAWSKAIPDYKQRVPAEEVLAVAKALVSD